MSDEMVKRIVDRFLCWPLPATVRPDNIMPSGLMGEYSTGTNLLTAHEAEQMIREIVLPELQAAEGEIDRLKRENGILERHYLATHDHSPTIDGGGYADCDACIMSGESDQLREALALAVKGLELGLIAAKNVRCNDVPGDYNMYADEIIETTLAQIRTKVPGGK